MMPGALPRPLVLIVMDGWGINPRTEANAIALAQTPYIDHIARTFPNTQLATSGPAVGLPEGQMGNSEVGHLNIGAGKRVLQEFTRVSSAIHDGSFFENPALLKAIQHVKQNNSALHLCGLIGPGGVHAHQSHLYACLQLAACIPNFALQEYPRGEWEPPKSEIVSSPIRVDKGFLIIPDAPGIGVELAEDAQERHPYRPRNVHTRLHVDGSVVDQ